MDKNLRKITTYLSLLEQNSYFFNDLLKIKNNTVDGSVRE